DEHLAADDFVFRPRVAGNVHVLDVALHAFLELELDIDDLRRAGVYGCGNAEIDVAEGAVHVFDCLDVRADILRRVDVARPRLQSLLELVHGQKLSAHEVHLSDLVLRSFGDDPEDVHAPAVAAQLRICDVDVDITAALEEIANRVLVDTKLVRVNPPALAQKIEEEFRLRLDDFLDVGGFDGLVALELNRPDLGFAAFVDVENDARSAATLVGFDRVLNVRFAESLLSVVGDDLL